MRRIFLFGAAALSLLLVSCSPSIEGTWIQPETSYTQEQGFVLYKGGVAEDINIDFVQFKTWSKEGDILIITGENAGYSKGEFVDTLKIESVTDDELVLSQAGYSFTYKRKE